MTFVVRFVAAASLSLSTLLLNVTLTGMVLADGCKHRLLPHAHDSGRQSILPNCAGRDGYFQTPFVPDARQLCSW